MSCLVDVRRMFLFMVEQQIFLLMGEVLVNAWCGYIIVGGEKKPKENF